MRRMVSGIIIARNEDRREGMKNGYKADVLGDICARLGDDILQQSRHT
jgi:hypothetical protein